MNVFLWIVAFLGIAFIYSGKLISKLIAKGAYEETVVPLSKALGVILCVVSMCLLQSLGFLI